MKKAFFIYIFIFCAIAMTAQKNECYDARQVQGIELFKKGDYEIAKKFFNFAMNCAYISANEKTNSQEWVQRCNDAIAGKQVQVPETAAITEPTQQAENAVTTAKPQSSTASKAAERAKREAAARAEAAAKARGEVVEQQPTTTAAQPQTSRFKELMSSADSCFNVFDYKAAESAYQMAAQTAQKSENQNDVQIALKKIDCCQQLSMANDLMTQKKFDEARTKYISAKAIGCINDKQAKQMIDNCNLAIANANQMINTNIIAPIAKDMVLIKGGIFMMGCESNCKEGETPVHQVVLKNFYLGKHEITQAQWEVIMGYNPSPAINGDFPVTNVSYSEIQEFVAKLNAVSGLVYRLPTESEWEFAARGGSKSQHTIYSGSNAADYVAWFAENSGNTLHPIGVKEPNELDIFDMSGNAAEWCSDWRSNYTGGFHLYPVGPKNGTEHIVRGGGYDDNVDFLRVFFRFSAEPDTKNPKIGFRLASNGFE
ncbi:MAG: formylglycine-generating enzyme family protein [Prevotellaceae bacterium]|jgi:formylglycine-generating enzyme required for sulfatase activity|nr:formylglycine-generating enzyme family protein [Prevotellaceae bacterium]